MTTPTPPSETTPAASNGEWVFEVRPQCSKCDRLAVVYDDYDLPLCGRHGTIFMTANRPASEAPPTHRAGSPTRPGVD